MLRPWVIAYLMLTALARPSLCPCSLARVDPRTSAPSSREIETGCPPRGCCAVLPSPTRTPPPRPGNPARQPSPCPCQGRCAAAVTVPATHRLTDRFTSVQANVNDLDSTGTFIGFLSLSAGLRPRWASHGPDLPFLDTADLLRAFHLLRC